jgi:endonuclease/exonuclease/phosphatase family metal-dependent hydrolase
LPSPTEGHCQEFTVLSHNIQVGIGSRRSRHLVLHGWKYLLPHRHSLGNLERIGMALREADIVGLNEADAGSYRSQYVNQAAYLANKAGFPFWAQSRTRDWGELAQHSNGLLSRWPIVAVHRRVLPGWMHGRGLLEATIDLAGHPLSVVVTHLALSRHGRFRQVEALAEYLVGRQATVVMGDLNCGARSPELRLLLRLTGLRQAEPPLATFPSWAPRFSFDHILCSPDLEFLDWQRSTEPLSDHLAVLARLRWCPAATRPSGKGGTDVPQ